MIRKIFLSSLALLSLASVLASCGFQVIYRENQGDGASYQKELATIRIQKDSGRLTQELRNILKDTFNPDVIEVDPKYVLVLDLTKGVSGTFITSTGASGRNKVTLTIIYKLKNLKGEIVAFGTTTVNDNYDVQLNRYGTYVAEDYARSNLVKIAALNIRNLLVNDLIELARIDENLRKGIIEEPEELEVLPPCAAPLKEKKTTPE